MLTRHPDWQSRLHQFLLGSLSSRFAYGKLDCCLFVADAVEAMTGTDIAAQFRGRYSSSAEAVDLCEAYSGRRSVKSLVGKALSEQGLPEIPVTRAQRGDVVLVRRSKDYSLGVIGLSGKEIVAASAQAYLRLPLVLAVRAWRV
jgi:hypothetical protein